MKNGHPSREHAHGKEKRGSMESLTKQVSKGGKHLREHHAETRREIDHGRNKERGMKR